MSTMNTVIRWSRRIAVPLAILTAGVLTPTAGSAHSLSAGIDAADTLAKGKALGVTSALGLLCCLLVVAAVALPIVLLIRRRRR
jgi:hypothetical protein